jgi:hypothetical protein
MYGLSRSRHSGATYLVDLEGQATRGLLDAVAHLYLRYALMSRCSRILVRARNISALYALESVGAESGTRAVRCYLVWVREPSGCGPARTDA